MRDTHRLAGTAQQRRALKLPRFTSIASLLKPRRANRWLKNSALTLRRSLAPVSRENTRAWGSVTAGVQ